jgi:hypothetical protein
MPIPERAGEREVQEATTNEILALRFQQLEKLHETHVTRKSARRASYKSAGETARPVLRRAESNCDIAENGAVRGQGAGGGIGPDNGAGGGARTNTHSLPEDVGRWPEGEGKEKEGEKSSSWRCRLQLPREGQSDVLLVASPRAGLIVILGLFFVIGGLFFVIGGLFRALL